MQVIMEVLPLGMRERFQESVLNFVFGNSCPAYSVCLKSFSLSQKKKTSFQHRLIHLYKKRFNYFEEDKYSLDERCKRIKMPVRCRVLFL